MLYLIHLLNFAKELRYQVRDQVRDQVKDHFMERTHVY